MRFIDRFLGLLTQKRQNIQERETIDYGDSPLRLTYDAYIHEYESIRREIELRLKLQDQAVNSLFVITAAIVTATEVFGSIQPATISFLERYPEAFLVFAIMVLYFPHLVVKNSYYIAVLGAYENNILSPKIDAIARILPSMDVHLQKFSEWEKREFPKWLRGVLRWDDYRSKIMFSGNHAVLAAFLSVFDNLVVFLPSITFFLIYILEHKIFEIGFRETGAFAIFLIAFYILICLSLIANMFINGAVYVGISKIEKGEKRKALLPE